MTKNIEELERLITQKIIPLIQLEQSEKLPRTQETTSLFDELLEKCRKIKMPELLIWVYKAIHPNASPEDLVALQYQVEQFNKVDVLHFQQGATNHRLDLTGDNFPFLEISTTDELIYVEMNRFSQNIQNLENVRCIMAVIDEVRLYERYKHRFSAVDLLARQLVMLKDLAHTINSYKKIFNEFKVHGATFTLKQPRHKLEDNVCFKSGAYIVKCPDNAPSESLKLHRLALYETIDEALPPLLHLAYQANQKNSIEWYKNEIHTILDNSPKSSAELLSTVDTSFFQTPLSQAIAKDNVNASLAFIIVITQNMDLDELTKKKLLNHLSHLPVNTTVWGGSPLVDEALYSSTPLLLAIQRGNSQVIDALLQTNLINPNQKDLRGLTALDWAFMMGNLDAFKKILDRGAKPELAKSYCKDKNCFQLLPLNKDNYMYYRQIRAHFWDNTELYLKTRNMESPERLEKFNQLILEQTNVITHHTRP